MSSLGIQNLLNPAQEPAKRPRPMHYDVNFVAWHDEIILPKDPKDVSTSNVVPTTLKPNKRPSFVACIQCRLDKSRCDNERPCHCCKRKRRAALCVTGCYRCRQEKLNCDDRRPCNYCSERGLECSDGRPLDLTPVSKPKARRRRRATSKVATSPINSPTGSPRRGNGFQRNGEVDCEGGLHCPDCTTEHNETPPHDIDLARTGVTTHCERCRNKDTNGSDPEPYEAQGGDAPLCSNCVSQTLNRMDLQGGERKQPKTDDFSPIDEATQATLSTCMRTVLPGIETLGLPGLGLPRVGHQDIPYTPRRSSLALPPFRSLNPEYQYNTF